MSKVRLTPKEKKTLHGLIKFPTLNDRELAQKVGLKLSTVTAIRRRLRNEDYFHTVRVPMLQKLGCEMMNIGYSGFRQRGNKGQVKQMNIDKLNMYDTVFLSYYTSEQGLFLSASENYTEVRKNLDEMQEHFAKHKTLDEIGWTYTLFPFEISKLLNYFDFSTLLEKLFDIKSKKTSKITIKFEDRDEVKLSKKEKLVFFGLCKYPEMPDNMISKKVGVSRQAVSVMGKRFIRDDIMRVLRVPNLNKLGYEIMVYAKTQFNPDSKLADRAEGVKYMMNEMPQFFMMSGNYENVLLAAFQNYEEYNHFRNEVLAFYEGHNYIRGEPHIRLFSISDMNVLKDHVYTDILARIWNLDKDSI